MTIVYPGEEVTIETEFRKKADVMQAYGITLGAIELDDISKCLHSVKLTIQGIVKATGTASCTLYLTKGENFRYRVYPPLYEHTGEQKRDLHGKLIGYKAGRPQKPELVPVIEEYMLKNYDCVLSEEIEADDALGIEQSQNPGETVLCSIDKDLDMITGWHFNPDRREMYHVSEEQGIRNFWMQVLTGDAVDNIPGLRGVGKATAAKLLEDIDVQDMRDICLAEYLHREYDEEYFRMNCILLWMLRKPLKETYPKDAWAQGDQYASS